MGGCGHIEGLKEEVARDKDKQLWVISNTMLLKTVILLGN